MYELWAKKRPVNGVGYPYELICSFDKLEQSFYMMDQLDTEMYLDCMVLYEKNVIFYREFTQYKKKKLRLF